MAIFKDGVQQEEFSLADYNSSPEALHALFQSKGLLKKPPNEMIEGTTSSRRERLMEERDMRMKQRQVEREYLGFMPNYRTMLTLYGGAALALCCVVSCRSSRRR